MPKTISIPASSSTRATSAFAGVSSISIGSIVIAFLPRRCGLDGGRSLPFRQPQHNRATVEFLERARTPPKLGGARVQGDWYGYPSRLHALRRVLRRLADRRRRGCDVGGL